MLDKVTAARKAAPRFPSTITGAPVASEAEEKRRSEEQEESEMRAKRVAHLLATRRGMREAARSESK
jgi:hypothetical protein